MPNKICLIVDDERSIRVYLKAVLEREKFQFLEADSAANALKLVHERKGMLDLIVTDVKMPGDINGVDLAYAVNTAFPEIALILMSGYPSPKPERPVHKFPFIEKPFRPEVILQAIKKIGF